MDGQESVRCSAGTNEVRSPEKYGSAKSATEIKPFMVRSLLVVKYPLTVSPFPDSPPSVHECDCYRCSGVEYNPVARVWRKL
jgi:hypothetical protein